MPEHRKPPGCNMALPGVYLEGVDQFDAAFFGINRSEAQHMDYRQAQVGREMIGPCYPFPLGNSG